MNLRSFFPKTPPLLFRRAGCLVFIFVIHENFLVACITVDTRSRLVLGRNTKLGVVCIRQIRIAFVQNRCNFFILRNLAVGHQDEKKKKSFTPVPTFVHERGHGNENSIISSQNIRSSSMYVLDSSWGYQVYVHSITFTQKKR